MAKRRPIPAKFFEESPLYKKFPVELPEKAEDLADESCYEPITMDCAKCGAPQMFEVHWRENDGWLLNQRRDTHHEEYGEIEYTGGRLEEVPPLEPKPGGDICSVQFICVRCKQGRHKFFYQVSDDGSALSKIGQSPPWSIIPADNVKRALGDHARDFQKGLANEASGYGVGAFAYYRRIVENVIAGLLKQVEELIAESGDKAKYHEALENIKDSQSAANRIAAVKAFLPDSLRPQGVNPLEVIYDALSVGLHAGTDEDCLDLAMMVREALVYLVIEVDNRRRAGRAFKTNLDAIKKQVEKRGKKKTDVQ